MTILAVHMGPALALYGMRWWPEALEKNFPDTFHFDVSKTQNNLYDLLILPVVAYWLLWAIPYFVFIFIIADKHIRQKGHKTIYGEFCVFLQPLYIALNVPEGMARPAVYMV